MRKFITCQCGRRWFQDDPDLYREVRVVYGAAFPPEGLAYGERYYCKDCRAF